MKGARCGILFGEQTPLDVIRELQPDVLIKGADYAEDQIVGADIVRAAGRADRPGDAGRWAIDHQSHRKIAQTGRQLTGGGSRA